MQLSCNSTRLAGPRRATSATSSRGATAPVRRCARPRHVSVCTAAAPASVTSAGVAGSSPAPAVYTPPSARIAANELQALSRLSKVVPDTLLLGAPVKLQAGTVSAQVLKGILAGGQLGLKPYLTAVENSLSYDRCRALAGAARADCQLEKALANVGAMLAPQVEGRVATELDARLAGDSAALVKAAKVLRCLFACVFVVGCCWRQCITRCFMCLYLCTIKRTHNNQTLQPNNTTNNNNNQIQNPVDARALRGERRPSVQAHLPRPGDVGRDPRRCGARG